MPIIYACIAPHAGDLIDEPDKVAATRHSMESMGAALQALSPDAIVIVNPHGFRVQSALSIALAERATADWAPDIRLEFEMDPELAVAIADRAEAMQVPIVRYIYGASGGPDCFIPLDWGAVVPLFFMGHAFEPKPRLVHLSPMRLLPYQTHYDLGRALGRVMKESDKRIALIASADQGHAHNAAGPYGFDPASAEYDTWMQGVIRKGTLDDLLSADPALVEAGKPDSLWPSLILAGALKENPLRARLLSYEVNAYFGILCAEFLSS
jgi:aromatic ring-opening dioxygenase LigB subunit